MSYLLKEMYWLLRPHVSTVLQYMHQERDASNERGKGENRRAGQVVWAWKPKCPTGAAVESDGAVAGRCGTGFKNTEVAVVKFGKHEKIKAVGDLQLAENGSEMVPQGLFADTQLLRYFFV